MNAMLLALRNAGLVAPETAPAPRRDFVAEGLSVIQSYVREEQDSSVFKSLMKMPGYELSDSVRIIEVQSSSVFYELNYDFDSPVDGAFIRSGKSFLTMKAFNELFIRATQHGKRLQIIPGLTNKDHLSVKVVDLDQIGGM